MRASRLIALLLTLQRRGRATAAQLAGELEVSVRTLYRDVGALGAAGVPVWAEPGPGGGIRLLEGWRTKLDGLTADETGALFLSAAPKAVADLGLAALAVSARSKVDATLPPALRGRASQIRERFLLDAPGWFTRDEPAAALPVVAEAVWSGRRLDLRYGPRGARRRVDPLGLVLKGGIWYLVAQHRGAPRTYRIGRIASAVARDEPCARPPGFDLARTWAEAAAAFDAALLRYPCRLRLSPRARAALPHVVPNEAIPRFLAAAGAPGPDGWLTVDLRLEGEEVAAGQLTALGDGVEVLEPRSLRRRLRKAGLALARRNRG